MKFRSGAILFLITSAGLVHAATPPPPGLQAFGQLLETNPTTRGNQTSSTAPVSVDFAGPLSTVSTEATYRHLEVNVVGGVSSGGPNEGISSNGYGFWANTLTFTPSNAALIGTGATAVFNFSLTGAWEEVRNDGAGGFVCYDITFNGSDPYVAGTMGSNGNFGQYDLTPYAAFNYTQGFTLGTPFGLSTELGAGASLSNNPGSGSVNIHLSLDLLGYEILDGSSDPIPGAMVTASGTSVPEPAEWEEVPAVFLLGAALMRRKTARQMAK